MCTMMINNELNGVELYFGSKPLQNTIENLKEFKYRWNPRKLCWYAKQNEQSLKLAHELATDKAETTRNTEFMTTKTTQNKAGLAPLWERVRFTQGNTDTSQYKYKFVGSNYTGLSIKETAAKVRKHLKQRFPEVKFSVTCKDYNSINCKIVSSPYDYKKLEYKAEHNKELLTIVEYATKFLQSYNFDDSDSMTDYFHTHFYGDSCSISYDYIQTEQTEQIKADIENYRLRLTESEVQAEKQNI